MRVAFRRPQRAGPTDCRSVQPTLTAVALIYASTIAAAIVASRRARTRSGRHHPRRWAREYAKCQPNTMGDWLTLPPIFTWVRCTRYCLTKQKQSGCRQVSKLSPQNRMPLCGSIDEVAPERARRAWRSTRHTRPDIEAKSRQPFTLRTYYLYVSMSR